MQVSRGSAHVLVPATVAFLAVVATAIRVSAPPPPPPVLQPGDTAVIHGPRRYDAVIGSTNTIQTFVDSIPLVVQAYHRFVIRVKNGNPDGTERVQRATVGSDSVTGTMGQVIREIAVQPTTLITVKIRGQASAGHLTVELLEIYGGNYTVFHEVFSRTNSNSDVVFTRTFNHNGVDGPPFFLWIVNGTNTGTSRLSNVTVRLNNDTVVGAPPRPNLTTGTFTLMVQVSLPTGSNTLVVTLPRKQAGFIDLLISSTDVSAPTLKVLAPIPNLYTRLDSVAVLGTMTDPNPARVSVNGVVRTVVADTFRFNYALPQVDGNHVLTFTAVDAAGNRVDSTRTVHVDRTPPTLSVTTPQNGFITNHTTIGVNATIADASPTVSLYMNGVFLLSCVPSQCSMFTVFPPIPEGPNTLVFMAKDSAGNTSTTQVVMGTRDTQRPTLTVTAPADSSTVSTPTVTVTGTASDAMLKDVKVNGVAVTLNNGAFSKSVDLVVGQNTIVVIATDSATNADTVRRTVTRTNPLPPDPSTVATPINGSVAPTIRAMTEFLYTATPPIQTNVTPGAISTIRAAVLRGRVLSRDAAPLSGVTVAIVNHPELGRTLSRADGQFDLAVNGGGLLTIDFSKEGYLTVQRAVDVPWQDYSVVDDVVLSTLDPAVTEINFTQPIQVARGSVVTDHDGARQATLFFRQGTQATMVMPDSSTQPLSTMHVRATEFSVGPVGKQAMPAELPPASAYTYAVEYSVDEALAAGAREVRFSQPVAAYVENFLDFPIGLRVPAGYYDRTQTRWAPAENGRVIKILGVTAGNADIDATGSGQASDQATLASLGITDAERAQLAQTYGVGQSLWRVLVTHFTAWDYNWPFTAGRDALPPPPQPQKPRSPDDPDCQGGSIILCQSQVLMERLPITGTPLSLTYKSSRVPGYKAGRALKILLSESVIPTGLKRIVLGISIAGRHLSQTFAAAPNQVAEFTWDGFDAYGRVVPGVAVATIRVNYLYRAVYTQPADFAQAFAMPAGVAITAPGGGGGGSGDRPTRNVIPDTASQGILITRVFQEALGPLVPGAATDVGGWTLSVHHTYDPVDRVLHLGDGRQRSAVNLANVIQTSAGDGSGGCISCNLGENVPATQAIIGNPHGIVGAPDGSVLVADRVWGRIRRITPDGIMTTVAGSGNTGGFTGDGGPATEAKLSQPTGIALGPDGSLFIADAANQRIRRVGPDGIITTVAGTGTFGFNGDNRLATTAQLSTPVGVAVGSDGSVYIAEGGHRIRRVDPSGMIATVAGTGAVCFLGQLPQSEFGNTCGENVPATSAKLSSPSGVAVMPDGSLLIADKNNQRIRRVRLDGTITTIAGNGGPLGSGDGGQALGAGLAFPNAVIVGPDGAIYITEGTGNQDSTQRVRRITGDGVITTVAGRAWGFAGDGGPATLGQLRQPQGVALGADGTLYVSDTENHRVRSIRAAVPGVGTADILIASEDGSEAYVFDQAGRHQRTLSSLGGSQLWTFAYDSVGRLLRATDAYGNATTITRDQAGAPTSISAPYGQRTTVSVNGSGYLASLTNEAGHSTILAVGSGGLLDSLTNAEGGRSKYAYDTLGRLQRAENPSGGFKTIERRGIGTVDTVILRTSLGRTTSYLMQQTSPGDVLRTTRDPAGHTTTYELGKDGFNTNRAPDETVRLLQESVEPRFGMTAPLIRSWSVTLPSGLGYTVNHSRRATLADPTNPLTAASIVDSVGVSGRWLVGTFDASSRTYVQISPEGRRLTAQLEGNGKLAQAQIDGLASSSRTYNQRGQLTGWQQGGRTITYDYDSATGYPITITDPLGRATHFVYDTAGHVVQQQLASGRFIRYRYDKNGNMTSLQPPGRPAHLFRYTTSNLLATHEAPDVGQGPTVTVMEYDADNKVVRVVRADSSIIGFGYDTAGRVATVTQPRGTLTFQYDPVTGRLATLTAPSNGAIAYSYDGSILTGISWSGQVQGGVSWRHNNDLLVEQQFVNNANGVTFAYDRDGLLVRAGDLHIGRSSQNQLMVADTLGGLISATSYNGHGEPLAYRIERNGATLYSINYSRDSAGRITQAAETTLGASLDLGFHYDSAGRISLVERNGVADRSFEYDDNGNRLRLVSPSGTTLGTYDDQDRLLTYGGATYSYSKTGELHTRTVGGQTTELNYDVFGNLLLARLPNGTDVEYVVDAQNRRVGRKVSGVLTQAFLYQDQVNVVGELDGQGNVVSRFVYATRSNVPDYLIRSGTTYRIVTDHRGSVRLVIDVVTGVVVQRMDYDEFGRVTANSNPGFQPFGFAGGLYDEATGLTHFGTRDYDAYTGRWTSPDPVIFRSNEVNRYQYVLGDPINFVDPHGFEIRTPASGPPNSSQQFPAADGGKTVRDYGPDGRATRDVDYGHDHGAGDPHAHDWDWSRDRPRGPGRPIEPGDIPVAAGEAAGVGAGTVAAIVAVLMVIPLNALDTPPPESGWCQIEGWCPDPDPRARKTPFCPEWLR